MTVKSSHPPRRNRNILVFGFLVAASSIAHGAPETACQVPAPIQLEMKQRIESFDYQMGDLIIGVDFDSGGSPSKYIRIRESWCYLINRKDIGRRQLFDAWISNKELLSEYYGGTFAVINMVRMKYHPSENPFEENYTFYRNSNRTDLTNSASKTQWVEAVSSPLKNVEDKYTSNVISRTQRDKILTTGNRKEFVDLVPGFIRYQIDRDNPAIYDRFDMWTYVSRSRPSTDFIAQLEAYPGYYTKIHTSAVRFDVRSEGDNKRLLRDKTFEINLEGPCHYISIDSPMEALRKKVILQFDDKIPFEKCLDF